MLLYVLMIESIKKQIDKSLETFMDKVKRDYKLQLVNPTLYESIREFSLRKGKRIRPLLLILSYKGYAKNSKKIPPSLYNAAICIELLHNFMLIHDDIIDRSNLRRGKPTLHRLLGKTVKTKEPDRLGFDLGIIAGDIVYALAIDAFLSIKEKPLRKEKALKYFIKTAAFTAMGEFIDTVHGVESVKKIKEEDVFLNYTLKTARYTFDCPLVVGAILAGAQPKDIKKLAQLGILVGQAFQIQDDILGVFETQKNIGKSILSDLAESKKTLLVCHAYEHLNRNRKRIFTRYFDKSRFTYRDLQTMRQFFIDTGSLAYSLQEIENRLRKTLKILQSLKIRLEYRNLIENALVVLFKNGNRIAKKYNIQSSGNNNKKILTAVV